MKAAFIRALRTWCQVLAAAIPGLPIARSLLDIEALAVPVLVVLVGATLTATVAFLQNYAEYLGNATYSRG